MPYCDCRLPFPHSEPDRYDDPNLPPFTCCTKAFECGIGLTRARYTILKNTLAVAVQRLPPGHRRFYRPLIRLRAGRMFIYGCKEGRLRLTRYQKENIGMQGVEVLWKSKAERSKELGLEVRACLGWDGVGREEMERVVGWIGRMKRGENCKEDLTDGVGRMEA